MGLLSINNAIQDDLANGKSREEIFDSFTAKSPENTAKYAYCLASIPYEELRRRYLKHNGILFLLLFIYAGATVVSEFPINFKQPTLFLTISVLVPLIFSYFVYQFHGGVYRLLGIWCLIDLAESLLLLEFTTAPQLIKIVVLLLVIAISFFISRKVFPNLKVVGPRQSSDGRFLL